MNYNLINYGFYIFRLLPTMARIGATFGFAFALGLLFVSFEIVSSGKIHFNIFQ